MRMTCLSVQLLLERALGPGLCLARYEPTVKVSTLRNLTAGSTAFTCSIGPVVLKGVPAAVCQMQYQRANESCETGPAGDFAESRYSADPYRNRIASSRFTAMRSMFLSNVAEAIPRQSPGDTVFDMGDETVCPSMCDEGCQTGSLGLYRPSAQSEANCCFALPTAR